MADAARDFRNKKKAKALNKAKKFEVFGIGIIGLLCILTLILIASFFIGPGPKSANGKSTVFVVETGDGAASIAANLSQKKLVRAGFAFKTLAVLTGASKKLKPGEYNIPSGASPTKVLNILTRGFSLSHKVTIPEGWTNGMAFERIANNQVLSGDLPPMPPEGSLAPDTYTVKRGDTRAAIVAQMQAAQSRIIDDLWLKRAADLPIKSKSEALVLASIVEKETGIASERPQVAAVFINRLRKGMKLQSDPTIIYGITKGLPIGRKIRKSEIEQNHPWNTYVIPALPPTPIANPGRDSIAAVLNPPPSNALFFVADGTGGHVFADTYAEHDKNVQKWRAIRAQKEQMEKTTDNNLVGDGK